MKQIDLQIIVPPATTKEMTVAFRREEVKAFTISADGPLTVYANSRCMPDVSIPVNDAPFTWLWDDAWPPNPSWLSRIDRFFLCNWTATAICCLITPVPRN